MSKYQRTEFNNEESSPPALDQTNILFSKQAYDKRRSNSLKNKLNSNLVDKLAMDSGLSANSSKKSNLIGLNSITNNNELNEPLTEIELDNDNHTIHHLDLFNKRTNHLKAHDHQTENHLNNHQIKHENQHELSNMKHMLVSLDTNLDNNSSNLNRSYLYSTNTLIDQDQQSSTNQHLNNNHNNQTTTTRTLGLMNPVHLNHCLNNSSFQASPNVSFFGLQTNSIDATGNGIFINFKNNARFNTFFRKIKFIWRRATLFERIFSLFLFLLLLIVCYLSFTVLSLQKLNRNLEEVANKCKYSILSMWC